MRVLSVYVGIIWNCKKGKMERKKEKETARQRERESERTKNREDSRRRVLASFPVVGFGDVSELLLDGVSVNILEVKGFGGGGGESAPFGRVPTGWNGPHRVHAWGLNFLDGFLDRVETV